jgi:hypothetical protein
MSEVDVDEILIIERKRGKSRFAGSLPAVQKLIEHVGSVHNIHLAKLWHSRRCIFLEGKDLRILSEIHNIFFSESQDSLSALPNLSIGGWGGWNYAIGSSMLLKNAGGQSIEIYCIIDSDYHTKEEREKRKKEAKRAGVHLHIWQRKEIENYCIVPSAIQRLIASRVPRRKRSPTVEDIAKQLALIFEELKENVFDALSTEILAQERKLGAGGANKIARDQIEKAWKSFEGRASIVSGKEVISRLSGWSQEEFNVSLNAATIARHMKADEIPGELSAVVESIERGESFPQ